MKRHKILMLGWGNIPAINSGLGIACYGLCKSLSKMADLTLIMPSTQPEDLMHGVHLITTSFDQGESKDVGERHAGTREDMYQEVIELPVKLDPYFFTRQDSTLLHELRSGAKAGGTSEASPGKGMPQEVTDDIENDDILERVMLYAKQVADIARGLDFDVIHAHDWMTFLAGIYVKNNSGKPLILHIHSLDYDRTGAGSKTWIYNIERYALSKADQVISVSNYTSGIIFSRYGLSSRKVVTVHNGIDPQKTYRIPREGRDKTVLFVGRITGQKGPKYFLQIALKVLELYSDVRFVMVGAGDGVDDMMISEDFASLQNRIELKGFLPQDELKKIYARSDVFCLPSVSEPFGLAALEAAQFGIPVVLSSRSGVSEILKSAPKADYWDIELMAQHISELLSNEKYYAKMAKAGLDEIKNFTWKKASNKIVKIYDALIPG